MKKLAILLLLPLFLYSEIVVESYAPEESASKIAVVTLGIDQTSHIEALRSYAQKHEYDLIFADKPIRSFPDLPSEKKLVPSWSIIPLLNEVMPEYEYAIVSTGKTLPFPAKLPVTHFLRVNKQLISFYADDENLPDLSTYILKRSNWTRSFLKLVWTLGQRRAFPKYEQGCIHHIFKIYRQRNAFYFFEKKGLQS